MKKTFLKLLVCIFICPMILTSCQGLKANKNIIGETGLDKVNIDRIIITNNRFTGKYIIIDKTSINRVRNKVVKAEDADKNPKLDTDFTFEFYSDIKKVASFKYLAGVRDNNTANLFDEEGNMFHVDSSIENEFIKRMMKKDNKQKVPEYYTSFVTLLIKKTNPQKNSVVVVDITKDFFVTSSLTVMEQKRILDSIDVNDVSIKFPMEVDTWDYNIKIQTKSYKDNECKSAATVTDKNGVVVRYEIEGKYNKNKWSYSISFK